MKREAGLIWTVYRANVSLASKWLT
jgi:hypothetical protein